MRVLYLNPFSQEVSGPDESLRTMLSALIPRGIDAHIVLPRRGPQVPRYEALGATVHYAPLAILRRNVSLATAAFPLSLVRATAAIAGLARRVGAELIHTNMEVLLEGGLAARALGIPHVLHYRGNTLDRPRRVFDGLTALWTWEADHVYCISQATAGVFLRRGRGANVEVLYNPIDIASFATAARSDEVRHALGGAVGTHLIGTVARIHPRKDLETFLRAAGRVAAREPRARFVVVGAAEGPAELAYLAQLQGLAAELNLGDRVTFAGARRDIPAVMRALDTFVLTSRHEGFGRVVAEAMAAGRPIVVTDEGAPPELVAGDRFGLCARPGDPGDFARQILRLVEEPETAGRLARAASERAGVFDAQVVADRVAARYQSLVRGRRAT